jgi:cell division protein FtsQ
MNLTGPVHGLCRPGRGAGAGGCCAPAFAIGSMSVEGDSRTTTRSRCAPMWRQAGGQFLHRRPAQVREALRAGALGAPRRCGSSPTVADAGRARAVALWGPSGSGWSTASARCSRPMWTTWTRTTCRACRPGQSVEVLDMYGRLRPSWPATRPGRAGADPRGGWRATLDSGAAIELGSGSIDEVLARTRRLWPR